MNCRGVRERLESYIDGELPADEAAAVEQHLTHCVACQAEWERAQLIVEALETWPIVTEPPHLTAEVLARIHTARPAPRLVPLWKEAVAGLMWCGLAYIILARLIRWMGEITVSPNLYSVDWLLTPARVWLQIPFALRRIPLAFLRLGMSAETLLAAAVLLAMLTALILERPPVTVRR